MSFGIGLGAFAQGLSGGLNQGLALGRNIKGARSENAKRKAFDDARKEYDSQISENVMQQAGQSDPGQAFDPKAAEANAKKSVGSFTDFLYNQRMPEIIDTMVQQGDLEGAERLQKWAADGKERKFMESFGKTLGAWAAGQSSGDYEPFAKSALDLLNKGEYDGLKATGYEIVKDGEGNATGLTFKLSQNGKKFEHTFNSIDEAAQFLSAQGSPQNRVKQWEAQQAAAQSLVQKRTEAAIGLGRDVALENVKQGGRERLEDKKHDNALQLEASKAQGGGKQAAEDDYVLSLLQERGFGDDEIDQYIAQKYLGGYRKGKSPEEFAQQIVVELAKDPMLANMPREQLQEKAQSLIEVAAELAAGSKRAPNRQAPGLRAPSSANLPLY